LAAFGARGFDIQMTAHPIVNTAPSPRDLLYGIDQVHPVSRACSLALEKDGVLEPTMARMTSVLENANEDSDGGTKLSRFYVAGVATRKG